MNLIERNYCVITEKYDLEHLYSFKKFPVFMGCLEQPSEDDIRVNMDWWISRETGLIQLNKLLPLDILYPESHGSGAIGALWEKHHNAFASFLNKIHPTSVLEIGGAHGILSKEYSRFGKSTWTILEPNPSPVEGCEARFIKGFFDDKFSCCESFDAVVHSHVFEHIYEPNRFMCHLARFMEEGKHLVFSLPNMQVMLERKFTNCVNFEHTVFLAEPYVEFLLSKHGFKLLRKKYFMDDHSIFYDAVRDFSVKPSELPQGLYQKNKQLYMDYVYYHEDLVQDFNSKISDLTQPLYLFGAHVMAQYLIAFGLDTKRIVSILDNDINKQGKRLYGTNLRVQSPKVLQEVKNPIVIIKAGVFNAEIKHEIVTNINPMAIFYS